MTPPPTTSRIFHIRIGRLVVDAAALGDLPREQLAAQLQLALTLRLSDAPEAVSPKGLAGHIADRAAQEIKRQFP
jgi:hypothetical protein